MNESEKKPRVELSLELDVGQLLDDVREGFDIFERALKLAKKKDPVQARKDIRKLMRTGLAAAKAYLEADEDG